LGIDKNEYHHYHHLVNQDFKLSRILEDAVPLPAIALWLNCVCVLLAFGKHAEK